MIPPFYTLTRLEVSRIAMLKTLIWKPWEGFHALGTCQPALPPPRYARPRAMVRAEQSSAAPHATEIRRPTLPHKCELAGDYRS
jgi:hypothetical protein